jgi:hypothetical protein
LLLLLFSGDLADGLVEPGLIGKSLAAGLTSPPSILVLGEGFLGLLLLPLGDTSTGFFCCLGLNKLLIDALGSI